MVNSEVINLNKVSIGYDKELIIKDMSISFPQGEMVAIIGSNGCGKSTMLKAIGRIINHQKGDILVKQQDIYQIKSKDLAKQLAILPQSPFAPSSLTCYELVSYGRYPYQKGLGKLSKADKEVINWAFKVTGMSLFKNRLLASLSGGQKQRVWIAMALAQKTDIILLDEPTTYLDLCHQLEVLNLLKKLNEENKMTIIMVLHDINLAARYCNYLIAMKDGYIYNYGLTKEVFTKEMLTKCFGVKGDVIYDNKGKPNCINYELEENI